MATGDERLRGLEEKYEGYTIYDNSGEKIGKVDELFVDENGREEYIGVKMGLFGLSGSTLIPVELTRLNEREKAVEVLESKDHVKEAPGFREEDEIDSEYESRLRRHFGLEPVESSERGTYERHSEAGGEQDAGQGGVGRHTDEEQRKEGHRGYRDREEREGVASTADQTGDEGTAQEAPREEAAVGYRGSESGDRDQDAERAGPEEGRRRRRVRRRMTREEDEEIIEEGPERSG